MRPVLAADLQHVAEAVGGHERGARAAPLEQRVRGHGHAVGEGAATAPRRPRPAARASTPSDWSRGVDGHLGGHEPAVDERDEVGEGAPDVDPEPGALAHSSRRGELEHRLHRALARPAPAPALRLDPLGGVEVALELLGQLPGEPRRRRGTASPRRCSWKERLSKFTEPTEDQHAVHGHRLRVQHRRPVLVERHAAPRAGRRRTSGPASHTGGLSMLAPGTRIARARRARPRPARLGEGRARDEVGRGRGRSSPCAAAIAR